MEGGCRDWECEGAGKRLGVGLQGGIHLSQQTPCPMGRGSAGQKPERGLSEAWSLE